METKEPERLGSCRVLGLKTYKKGDSVYWKRDNDPPTTSDHMSKRQIFAFTGGVLGHYPVAGRLRLMCSMLKRGCQDQNWDDQGNEDVQEKVIEIVNEMKSNDVGGKWTANINGLNSVWCDASQIAMAIVVEDSDGSIIEDGSWLRKTNDPMHINLAELEAVLKGIKCAINWKMKKFQILSDSQTVVSWITTTLNSTSKVKVVGLSEILVKRRLNIISNIIRECSVDISIKYVPSSNNKADALTRMKQSWIHFAEQTPLSQTYNLLKEIHNVAHAGAIPTFNEAKAKNKNVSMKLARKVISDCNKCQSIDPAPVQWESHRLEVDEVWERVGVDTVHYNQRCFLSMVDHGPSRFAIWRLLSNEREESIVSTLRSIFSEHGAPQTIVVDNASVFHGRIFNELAKSWRINVQYRAAHRQATNGIVERNHRTIKSSAARTRRSVFEALYWYNSVAKMNGNIPEKLKSSGNRWRRPWLENGSEAETMESTGKFKPGDLVFVKPAQHVRCTEPWKEETIKSIVSNTIVELSTGTRRHIADIRKRCSDDGGRSQLDNAVDMKLAKTEKQIETDNDEDSEDDQQNQSDEENSSIEPLIPNNEFNRPTRIRRQPAWMNDYICDL